MRFNFGSGKPKNGQQEYTIAPATPPCPRLPGRVVVEKSVEALVEHMAEDFIAHSLNCVRSFGDFHLALSDGPALQRFYQHLMIDPSCRLAPWMKTHLWLVDELRVERSDPDSTWNTVGGFFGEHAGIPRGQQHPIPALSDRVVAEYEASLRSALEWRERGHDRLDYVLVEVGDDGGVGNLRPKSPALRDSKGLVRVNSAPAAAATAVESVTMTLPFINAARFIGVVVTGESRRRIVERIVAGREPVDELPARGLDPIGGALTWYLDHDACPGATGGAGGGADSPPTG